MSNDWEKAINEASKESEPIECSLQLDGVVQSNIEARLVRIALLDLSRYFADKGYDDLVDSVKAVINKLDDKIEKLTRS